MNSKDIVIRIKVKEFGDITLELFPSVAPNSVANFLYHVKNGLYKGLIFHRVIKGFMIQGGGSNISLKPIKGEFKSNGFNNPIKHERGVISYARTSNPNSATSQFFIMHQNAPHLDGAYAAFGKVINGIEVVDKIANVKTNHIDQPLQDVMIEDIEILEMDTPLVDPVYL